MKGKILVVDDEADILHGIKTLLLADYYNVVTAKTGLEAVEVFKKETPDLVILDVGLPDINGFEVMKRIKKSMRDAYIPIIFLTASVDMESKIKAFHGGAVDYLTKPFSSAELLVRIENFLKIKHQHDLLKEESTQDTMTGVLNKANFMSRAEEEVRKAYVYKKTAALMMTDIDNFKQINDSVGHLAGDQVIIAVSTRIKSIVRPTDILGRFGGDEFVLLLPNTTSEGAGIIAKRILDEVKKNPIRYAKEKIDLSISIGIADTTKPRSQNVNTLVRLADKALYKAKRKKGNTFVIA